MTPALSDQYHRARRQFALFSALLLMWALVGVEVDEKPLNQVDVELLNPEVVPLVLAVLVVYFWYRTLIEWFQCDENRRKAAPSRVDIFVANALGGCALLIPVFQELLKVRFAQLWVEASAGTKTLLIYSFLIFLFMALSFAVPSFFPSYANKRLGVLYAHISLALAATLLIANWAKGVFVGPFLNLALLVFFVGGALWGWQIFGRMSLSPTKAFVSVFNPFHPRLWK